MNHDSSPAIEESVDLFIVPDNFFQHLGSNEPLAVRTSKHLTVEYLSNLRREQRCVFIVQPGTELVRLLNRSGVNWYAILPELSEGLSPAGFLERLEISAANAVEEHLNSETSYLETTFLEQLDQRNERRESLYTLTNPELDRALGGGLYPGLHVLGGVTAGGKTALALHIALINAELGRPVLYITYEQSKAELWARLISPLTGHPLSAFRNGRTGETAMSAVLREDEHFAKLSSDTANLLRIQEGDGVGSSQQWGLDRIGAEVRRLRNLHGQSPLVILDYLQRMPSDLEVDKRQKIDDIVMSLQVRLGREEQTPILLLSSVSRGNYGELLTRSLDERLAVWKESGGIEYTAYSAILLYPLSNENATAMSYQLPPTHGLSAERWRYLVADLVKNREGEAGLQLLLKWWPARGKYESMGKIDLDLLKMRQSRV